LSKQHRRLLEELSQESGDKQYPRTASFISRVEKLYGK
jgi:hypothetical protein